MSLRCYRAFGLTFASALELPELPTTQREADITICYGRVPVRLENPTGQGVFYEISPSHCLLNLDTIAGARYWIHNGDTIVIERTASACDGSVGLFLLASAMGALLYQRNLLPMHGSAIQTSKGAVLFCGVSGSGKSTIAAAFSKRGYPVLTDDICAISFDGANCPQLARGPARLKLWGDSLKLLEWQVEGQTAVRSVLGKYPVWVNTDSGSEHNPVAAIYLLQPTNVSSVQIELVQGMAKLAPVQSNAFRDKFAVQMGKSQLLFEQSSALAQQVRLCRVVRPKHINQLDRLVDRLEEDIEEGLASSG